MVNDDEAWTTALADFSAWLRAGGRSAGTVRLRRYYVARLALRAVAGPWEVTGDDLTRWIAEEEWSPETLRSARSSLRVFFGWALRAGRRGDDPTVSLLPVPVPPPSPHPVPDDVYVLVVGECDERTLLMVRLGAELGLRRGEIAAVHGRDVARDYRGWSLRVKGKGGRTRVLPIPDGLAATLRAVAGEGWVFPSPAGGHLTPDHVGRLVRRVMPAGVSTHSLRHRFATRAYGVDRDLLTVQALLGHASPVTTRRYVALEDDRLRQTVLAAAG